MAVEAKDIQTYFNDDSVVEHYARAVNRVGLWKSEETIFTRVFRPKDTILDLGTGTGRIAFGLAELGYERVMGADISRQMIRRGREINRLLDYGVAFHVADATALPFGDRLYEGVIFGFNGLMQIPGADRRLQAMREVFRVLAPGGWFVFTTHDRDAPHHRKFWIKERKRWNKGAQDPDLLDFGDRYEETPLGKLYIHIPTRDEVRAALKEAGFRIDVDVPRSSIAQESIPVREFSDECRFWIAQRPEEDCP